ncbi:MAG: transposase [Bacteroidales bacterium]|nr:transposase [Bacteroidales bacterium]
MPKIIILQKYYNISDEQIEYQINDCTSFKDFLDYLEEIKFLIQEPSGFLENV